MGKFEPVAEARLGPREGAGERIIHGFGEKVASRQERSVAKIADCNKFSDYPKTQSNVPRS
jgi:hypothetical protein